MNLGSEKLLLSGVADTSCRAVVVLPARNEEASLPITLDALARQVDLEGKPLAMRTFEILLLLNNCTDSSVTVARRWQREHPEVALHCCERDLSLEKAHIGTVRRLLMDTAWSRLQGARESCAILSTDADSYVAKDWIARTLLAVEQGADAVGGVVELIQDHFVALPKPVRDAYISDRRYQALTAEVEDLLDPQKGDACPRHLEHFGASLACTPKIYARAGGMPAVTELEDVAFVDRLRRVDATLRHDPKVVVTTSGRLRGRVTTGLSGQLLRWQRMHDQGELHCVPSSVWLIHRFGTLRSLRQYFFSGSRRDLTRWSKVHGKEIRRARARSTGVGEFLHIVDCNRLIEETFTGERMGLIDTVNENLARWLTSERNSHAVQATNVMVSGAAFEKVDPVFVPSNAL